MWLSCHHIRSPSTSACSSRNAMSRFGAQPEEFFSEVYRETPPWDIGAAQPALLELLQRIPPVAPILDVGCGSGDLAIALAHAGHDVLGVDFVPAAIAQANEKV